jgi:hypothetical protein
MTIIFFTKLNYNNDPCQCRTQRLDRFNILLIYTFLILPISVIFKNSIIYQLVDILNKNLSFSAHNFLNVWWKKVSYSFKSISITKWSRRKNKYETSKPKQKNPMSIDFTLSLYLKWHCAHIFIIKLSWIDFIFQKTVKMLFDQQLILENV